jgi:DNA-binding MarR family transcriptional regulator
MDVLLNYFEFASDRDKIHARYKVNERESIILRIVTSSYHGGNRLTVSDVIQIKSLASPATLHASLKALIQKKLIEIKPCDQDARVKKLLPTEKAIKLYKELGMLLVRNQ